MFGDALQDHSRHTNSFQSSVPRVTTSSLTTGAKRKREMSNIGQSALGSLHSAVYFDENDFDDDDLDLDDDLLPQPKKVMPDKQSTPEIFKRPDTVARQTPLSSYNTDIKYPELPPFIENEGPAQTAPSSSGQMTWPSSSPSHLQPPPKRRTFPWKETEPMMNNNEPRTPRENKSSYPWNKTASAVKDEQKVLRKQNKQRQQVSAKPNTNHPERRVASLFLSDEQRTVLEAVVERNKSIFFTGSAGTGKSVLMREIIKKLREKYRKEVDRVAVTASTGLAACNIGGVTLHSFAGIGLGKEDASELVKKLPPVPDNSREAKFAFAAATWNTSIEHTILLTHIFRQKDPEFAAMLNEMRLGKISPRTVEAFKKLSRPLDFHDSIEATELFPTRMEVENANRLRMSRLSGETMTFNAVDSGAIQDKQFRDKLLANCMAPQVIQLKKGAQVMLIKNMEDSLVNGSLGRVAAFMDDSTFDFYKQNERELSGEPEDLSDEERVNRARKKLKDLGHKEKDTPVTTGRKWPLVCFVQPDGTERHLLCQPETWKIELPNGEVQAQRQQVPLILAWALSIHKAQGQTLQRVKVDLGRVFEKGQAYVALSRATCQDGLQVSGFNPQKVMVHPKVIEFYSNLVNASAVAKRQRKNPQLGRSGSNAIDNDSDEFADDLEDEAVQYMHG
ncbi:P-loop containing nucleoside triphosphate hydrolase protein [Elaphomyces granulatus]